MLKNLIFLFIFFLSITLVSDAQRIELLQQGKHTSIRGLSVVNDSIAWISGSRGNIAITINGGKTWAWQQIKGFEQADFRDIEAFSDKEAVIMSSGTPALILKTTDGGTNWQVKYRNTDTIYFLDAMDFANKKHGFILGDPIKGHFLLLETKNGGETWATFDKLPESIPGEAAFAASGTCLRVDKDGTINIVTGGKVARHLYIGGTYKEWHNDYLPIKQGLSSQGAFSYADFDVFVGGDYSKYKDSDRVAVYTDPMITSIKSGLEPSRSGPAGFQSCVERINNRADYLSTGTSGSNITTDGGKTWTKIDTVSYNVCQKAKKGNLILLAGDGGKIGRLIR